MNYNELIKIMKSIQKQQSEKKMFFNLYRSGYNKFPKELYRFFNKHIKKKNTYEVTLYEHRENHKRCYIVKENLPDASIYVWVCIIYNNRLFCVDFCPINNPEWIERFDRYIKETMIIYPVSAETFQWIFND